MVRENSNPLLQRASAASIGVLFGLLVWRSLSSYELASQFHSHYLRALSTLPVIVLMVLNVLGFGVSIFRPLQFKNQLKAILSVNLGREWLEFAYNIVMIVMVSTKAEVPREAYIGRLFMNIWWSALCFSFSRSRWVLAAAPQLSPPRRQF